MRKDLLIGRVTSDPRRTARCLRFEARFARDEITEVTISDRTPGEKSLRKEMQILRIGDKIAIGKYARIGYLQIKADEVIRLVDVKDEMVVNSV